VEEPVTRSASTESRVLVVDDNRDAAESMAVLLRMEGHLVNVVYDGLAALDAVQSFRPDAILLDIGLPGLDGFEVAERIRAAPGGSELLIVAISGYGEDAHRDRAKEIGFDHHFVKPIEHLGSRNRRA
jgi:two-component system CheB/CheR fusion protein